MLVRRSDMSLILTVWFLVRPSFAMQHLTSALRLCLCNILVTEDTPVDLALNLPFGR